jgi:hypothetical protein
MKPVTKARKQPSSILGNETDGIVAILKFHFILADLSAMGINDGIDPVKIRVEHPLPPWLCCFLHIWHKIGHS